MKSLLLIISTFLFCQPAQAHVLEEVWNKYAPSDFRNEANLPAPGRTIGSVQGIGESALTWQWRYRPQTYEMHFENPETLARSIYSLALYAHDVSPQLPAEKFYRGVLGFHYSGEQVASWLNHMLTAHMGLTPQENEFVGFLLEVGLIGIGPNGFQAGDKIRHVLGAAPGKTRAFGENLRHERLHVFWDEDEEMRQLAQEAWKQMSPQEQALIRNQLQNYAQDNEAQLIEEWAVGEAEKGNFNIK